MSLDGETFSWRSKMTEQDKDKFEEITGDDRDDDDPSKKKFLEKYW